ncbi:MAG: hypothetical protein IJZ72_06845 [Oscillospiraceae bacterium]|nr:hypothetical protein [Oscillospiraceae bacterium]
MHIRLTARENQTFVSGPADPNAASIGTKGTKTAITMNSGSLDRRFFFFSKTTNSIANKRV